MKLFNAIAVAGLAATSFSAIESLMPQSALAYCMVTSSVTIMENIVRAGGNWDMAWRSVKQAGRWDGTELCAMQIRGAYAKWNDGALPPMP